MDIRQLRYFLAIVEERSFTRAASRLGVAQPALSLHVRNMEEELGIELLIRSANGIMPTEAGAVLVERAQCLLNDFERMKDELRSWKDEPVGTVRVGLPGTISLILGPAVIAQCQERYPKIKIVIAEAMSGFVRDWLANDRVDLAILYSNIRDSRIKVEFLFAEELVLLAEKGSTSASDAIDALNRQRLIMPSKSHGLRELLDRELAVHPGIDEPVIEVDSYANIKELVRQGYGCSILPYHAVQKEWKAGELDILHFSRPRLWREAYLARNMRRPLTQAAETVWTVIQQVVRDLVETEQWLGARLSKTSSVQSTDADPRD